MQFYGTAHPISRCILDDAAWYERFFFTIIKFCCLLGHNLIKNKIRSGQNIFMGPEILCQIDATLYSVILESVRIVLMHKQRTIRHTETINGLLHIAYVESVIYMRNKINNSFLYTIRILVFVHHDFFESILQLKGHFGWLRVIFGTRFHKECQTEVFQVAKVHDALFFFSLIISPMKGNG